LVGKGARVGRSVCVGSGVNEGVTVGISVGKVISVILVGVIGASPAGGLITFVSIKETNRQMMTVKSVNRIVMKL
jgi:hypothetical protein